MKSAISYLFVSLNCFPNISPHIFRIKIFFKTKCHLVSTLKAQLVKNPPAMQETPVDSWVGKIHWRRERLPTPVSWTGEFSPWSCRVGQDWATFTFTSISCGNPVFVLGALGMAIRNLPPSSEFSSQITPRSLFSPLRQAWNLPSRVLLLLQDCQWAHHYNHFLVSLSPRRASPGWGSLLLPSGALTFSGSPALSGLFNECLVSEWMNDEGKGEPSETKAQQSTLLLTVQNQCLIPIRKIMNKSPNGWEFR